MAEPAETEWRELTGDLLHPDPRRRLEALESSKETEHPKVMMAALVGGHLYDGVTEGKTDLGRALLRWLVQEGGALAFWRYLAEDSIYGSLATLGLTAHEQSRALQRAPMWLSPGRACAYDTGKELVAGLPLLEGLNKLAFRTGSAGGWDQGLDHWLSIVPSFLRFFVRWPMGRAMKNPSKVGWIASPEILDRAAHWRRWPIERLEEGAIVVCSICGEPLPADRECCWCGTDPESEEPPTLLGIDDLLEDRALCQVCGVDLTTRASPVRCPCCWKSL